MRFQYPTAVPHGSLNGGTHASTHAGTHEATEVLQVDQAAVEQSPGLL